MKKLLGLLSALLILAVSCRTSPNCRSPYDSLSIEVLEGSAPQYTYGVVPGGIYKINFEDIIQIQDQIPGIYVEGLQVRCTNNTVEKITPIDNDNICILSVTDQAYALLNKETVDLLLTYSINSTSIQKTVSIPIVWPDYRYFRFDQRLLEPTVSNNTAPFLSDYNLYLEASLIESPESGRKALLIHNNVSNSTRIFYEWPVTIDAADIGESSLTINFPEGMNIDDYLTVRSQLAGDGPTARISFREQEPDSPLTRRVLAQYAENKPVYLAENSDQAAEALLLTGWTILELLILITN